ncbi:GFA family protein [Roseovarius sp. C7]|uniref:GFA family protein n=1 Tax=Roseovarius sp. C7 TaxID=3398643 RepID=UPI0039F69DF7
MTSTGSCLCGSITYRLDHAPETAHACHCGHCQKWSGGVNLSTEVPETAFHITGGAEHLGTYKSSDWAERCFCTNCGSSIFSRITGEGPHQGMHYICIGTLDQTEGLRLDEEIFIDRKPAGYGFEGDRKRLTEADFLAMVGG